jgi:hypothetical protein
MNPEMISVTDKALIGVVLVSAIFFVLFFGPLFGLPDVLNIGWGFLFSGMGYQL